MGMSTLFRLAIAGLACAFACPRPTQGVVVLNALTTYQQDFNFLDNANTSVIWQNDQTTETTTGSPGWFWQNHSATPNDTFFYVAGSPPSNNNGRAYAMLDLEGDVNDTAMGSFNGTLIFATTYGLVFQNNTNQTISGVTVSYTGEQWRGSNIADAIQFSYQVSPTLLTSLVPSQALPMGWTAHTALNFVAPFVGSRPLLIGNDAPNRQALTSTISVNWNQGDFLALRWYDTNTTLAAGGALAIDDLTVSFAATVVPEASPFVLMGGAVAVGCVVEFWRRTRRRRATTTPT